MKHKLIAALVTLWSFVLMSLMANAVWSDGNASVLIIMGVGAFAFKLAERFGDVAYRASINRRSHKQPSKQAE